MAKLRLLLSSIRGLWRDERGITGLETSIMLIAFVVVASVFAFAVLRMGVFSADRLEKSVGGSVEGITSQLALRDLVVAHGEELPAKEYVRSVRFHVRHQTDPVELSDSAIVVNIKQGNSCIPLEFGNSGPNPGLSWNVNWANGPGPILNVINSPAEIILNLYGLRDKLTAGGDFAVAIKPREAPDEPCIPPNIGDSSLVLLAGNIDLGHGEILDDGNRAEFRLDYYDATQPDGGVSSDLLRQEDPYVGRLTFLVHNSAPSGSIDLSSEVTVVSYFDSSGQTLSDLPFLDDIGNSQVGLGWGMLGDSGPELGPGERAEIQVNLFGLEMLLEARDEFTVQIRPPSGQPLTEDKQVPSELKLGINRLD